MKPQAQSAIGKALAAAGILLMVWGCNMPGFAKPSGLGSQAQAQRVGHQAGPLEGALRLEYNHEFSFKYSGGSNQVDFDITVQGEIPLTETSGALCPQVCKGDGEMVNEMGYCRQVTGAGTVNFDATASIRSGKKICDCTLPDSIKVDIQGKSFHEWVTPGDYCQLESLALKVNETWMTEHKWSCVCNTPEETENLRVEDSMAMFPSIENPELATRTMVFPIGCPADSELKEDLLMGIIGNGTYRWVLHSGGDEGANSMDWGPQYADYGTVTPKPMQCRDGYWGPSLESIEDPLQWEPLD